MIPKLFDPDDDVAEPEPSGELTVARVVGEYLAWKQTQFDAGHIGRGALVNARRYCLAFVDYFGSLPISSCRRGDLRRFLGLRPCYRSPCTQHNAVGNVVQCFRWAVDDGLIEQCPYKRPDLPPEQPREPIWDEEVRRILTHARQPSHTRAQEKARRLFVFAVWFLWQTGARTCEMFKLDWTHYRAEGFFELEGKTTRATGDKRRIPLGKGASRLIEAIRRLQGNPVAGPVFPNSRGGRWNKDSFGEVFRWHADRAGVRKTVSAYCLRHNFCCSALEAGCPDQAIAFAMGHSTTKKIAWYGRGISRKMDVLRQVQEMADRARRKPP